MSHILQSYMLSRNIAKSELPPLLGTIAYFVRFRELSEAAGSAHLFSVSL